MYLLTLLISIRTNSVVNESGLLRSTVFFLYNLKENSDGYNYRNASTDKASIRRNSSETCNKNGMLTYTAWSLSPFLWANA